MQCDLIDVIKAEVLDDYKLRLQFEDGVIGIIDISKHIPFKGVFSRLNDKVYFAKVVVNPDIGTICWENGADLSPTFLRKNVKVINN